MDELEYAFGEGPCLSAMRTGTMMHVPDVAIEHRWPTYIHAVAGQGVGFHPGSASPVGRRFISRLEYLLFSSPRVHGEDIARAELFGEQSAKTLRLELRLARLKDAKQDLAAAMQSRTAIDIATGAIMAQNRCSQETAMSILKRASSTRNVKLRDVAAGVIESIAARPGVQTYFGE
jgi:ANTAR domain